MSNYKETQQSGSVYTRASIINIANGLEKKSIQFNEEEIFISENGNILSRPLLGSLSEQLTEDNMATAFPIINPETGEETGSEGSYAAFQVLLYSLYLFLAERRDTLEADEE